MSKYESTMHVIADGLMEQFKGSGAVNYIEQIFTDNNDESNSFVLTMQKVKGLTPCQKLEVANSKIRDLRKSLIIVIDTCSGLTEKDKKAFDFVNETLNKTK